MIGGEEEEEEVDSRHEKFSDLIGVNVNEEEGEKNGFESYCFKILIGLAVLVVLLLILIIVFIFKLKKSKRNIIENPSEGDVSTTISNNNTYNVN